MPKVRMISLSAGPLGVRYPGTIVDVSDGEAAALCWGNHVEAVRELEHAPETAALEVLETEDTGASETQVEHAPETAARRRK